MPLSSKTKFIPFNASKWLSVQLLIDVSEMRALLQSLGSLLIFPVGSVIKRGQEALDHENFLSGYSQYIEALKNGHLPEEALFRPLFSSAFTLAEDHLYAQHVGTDSQIIRAIKPVVQLQAHSLNYSKADGKFHHMVFGNDSVLWGIQFSYPQLCEDTETYEAYRVDERFPNTALFKALQKWTRTNTLPTPFVVDGRQINVPMRIGKECLCWINHHPQLVQKNISVKLS